jgi:hypothetical protein
MADTITLTYKELRLTAKSSVPSVISTTDRPSLTLWPFVFFLITVSLLGHMAYKELLMCLHTMEDIGDARLTAGSNLGFIWR